MRRYRLSPGAGIDSLAIETCPVPAVAAGQVLIRVRAASLNYRDLLVARGSYGAGVPAELLPLSDAAGEVVEVGPGVTRARAGDRVAPIFSPSWIGGGIAAGDRAWALGGSLPGVLAEYVVTGEHALVQLPPHLSFVEASTLPCAAVTAWNALYGLCSLRPGQSVLVLGTGGVSIFALQIARAAGARVIATTSSGAKLDQLLTLGASDVINYRETPGWDEAVLRLTGGEGVDHVVEVGGAMTLPRSIAAARVGGSVHLIGVLTGGQIDPLSILRRNLTVRGVFVGSRAQFEALNAAVAMHALRPVIDRVFPFREAPAAYRHLESAVHVGKVVIQVDGDA